MQRKICFKMWYEMKNACKVTQCWPKHFQPQGQMQPGVYDVGGKSEHKRSQMDGYTALESL
jgi:hypothetical protein